MPRSHPQPKVNEFSRGINNHFFFTSFFTFANLTLFGFSLFPFAFVFLSSMLNLFRADESSESPGFFLISSFSFKGSRCRILHFLFLVSPAIMTKLSSITSTMMHLQPASLPAIFTHNCPISIVIPPKTNRTP